MAWRVLPLALDTGLMSNQRSQVLGEPVLGNAIRILAQNLGRLEGLCGHQAEDPGRRRGMEVICRNSLQGPPTLT